MREVEEEAQFRFWLKVDKSAGEDACWIWTGWRNKGGYGVGYFRKTTAGAHVIAFCIHTGIWPPPSRRELLFRHRCANRICVNPAHLIPGTSKENAWDVRARRRRNCQPGELWTYEDEITQVV